MASWIFLNCIVLTNSELMTRNSNSMNAQTSFRNLTFMPDMNHCPSMLLSLIICSFFFDSSSCPPDIIMVCRRDAVNKMRQNAGTCGSNLVKQLLWLMAWAKSKNWSVDVMIGLTKIHKRFDFRFCFLSSDDCSAESVCRRVWSELFSDLNQTKCWSSCVLKSWF